MGAGNSIQYELFNPSTGGSLTPSETIFSAGGNNTESPKVIPFSDGTYMIAWSDKGFTS